MLDEITREYDSYMEATTSLHEKAMEGRNINQYNLDCAYERFKRYLRALKRHAVQEREKQKELPK